MSKAAWRPAPSYDIVERELEAPPVMAKVETEKRRGHHLIPRQSAGGCCLPPTPPAC